MRGYSIWLQAVTENSGEWPTELLFDLIFRHLKRNQFFKTQNNSPIWRKNIYKIASIWRKNILGYLAVDIICSEKASKSGRHLKPIREQHWWWNAKRFILIPNISFSCTCIPFLLTSPFNFGLGPQLLCRLRSMLACLGRRLQKQQKKKEKNEDRK